MENESIPHSRPLISDSDVNAVASVVRSGQLAQGPAVQRFEEKIARFIGKKYSAATSSGTTALHLALLALDVSENDEVIIPSFVCLAVLNAVNYTRATPIIVDIEPLTFNISVSAVQKAITKKTKAIIVPHMFGYPAEIDKLAQLNIPIIEDCAQALGAENQRQKVGSFGLLSVFSFYATKVIASGEGGMVLSDSEDLISRIKKRRDYDKRNEYILSYNYKMTDIQAALGIQQFSSLGQFIRRRKEIAAQYLREFKNLGITLPLQKDGYEHIYYRFVISTKDDASDYIKRLHEKKIMCQPPVHTPLHIYRNLTGFPQATEAWRKTISIPLYPSLTEHEVERIIKAVQEVFSD